ncbi:MAG: hypothetical protein ACW99G_12620 [Candidatus Thorarchaeota archaeon]|jgi:hypothetical protein
MADIDPEEDNFVETLLGFSLDIAEKALLDKGYPMEKIQALKKTGLELRLMFDEIIQMDREKRTREDMEKAYRKYLGRMGATETSEKDIRKAVEAMCKMFIPDYTS